MESRGGAKGGFYRQQTPIQTQPSLSTAPSAGSGLLGLQLHHGAANLTVGTQVMNMGG